MQRKIVTRKEAREKKLKYYYTGIPCLHGHIDKRFTSSDVCLTCGRARSLRDGRKNIKSIINNYNKRTYGITTEEIELMKSAQNFKCAICENKFLENKRLHVDHDHESGFVRAILCSNCNTGLGLFKDNVYLMYKAIQYIQHHKELHVNAGKASSEWK